VSEIINGLQQSIASKEDKVIIGKDCFIQLIREEEIQKRNRELGNEISVDYKSKYPIFIGVLNGAFIFLSDLIRNVSIACEVDFIKLSSYGGEKISAGKVTMLKDLNCNVTGRDIIIVEDIVDSGLSIKFIMELIDVRKPTSVKIASLLLKPDSLKYNVKIDYIGFKVPSQFVIGYGLDYTQKYRNLKSLYVLSEKI
jgi:hypoxanthine phosphoribosyltransferase